MRGASLHVRPFSRGSLRLPLNGELAHRLPSLKRTRTCDNTEGKMTSVCITFSLFFLFGSAESGIRGSQDEERFVIFSEKSDNK